jgi:hypothetical protein
MWQIGGVNVANHFFKPVPQAALWGVNFTDILNILNSNARPFDTGGVFCL